MTDDFGNKVAELMEKAEPTPSLRSGWKGRALAALAQARPARGASRGRWIANTAVAVIVLVALGFVPYSTSTSKGMMAAAEQAAAADMAARTWETASGGEADRAEPRVEESPEEERIAPYRRRAVEFVERHYANDPEMLTAAGSLTDDGKAGLALLKRAVETGKYPAAWAPYVLRVMQAGPRYDRVGAYGVDPEDLEGLAEAEKLIRESGLPAKLSPEETAPVLAAIRAWQAADPQNALPVVLEMTYLYGLHEDAQALSRWEYAASLPVVNNYLGDRLRAMARLLSRMGMSQWQAISTSYLATDLPTDSRLYPPLRTSSRIATYEGRVAQIEGRPKDAIAWWNGTISLGQHMQDSADSLIGFLVGLAVEGIGASPTWRWCPDRMTGIPNGPVMGGRYFYGPQHAFYVAQVGEAADARLRDSLIKGKMRSQLLRENLRRAKLTWSDMRALKPLALGLSAAELLVLLLLLFAAIGTWARRQADEATGLRLLWKLVIGLVAVLPVASTVIAFRPLMPGGLDSQMAAIIPGGLALSFLVALLLPLLAARSSRRPSARLATAWRGNLRQTLPITIALCALISVGLGIAAKMLHAKWVREWYKHEEMARVVRAIGPAWANPPIPADSWRAEYPPEPRAEGRSGQVQRGMRGRGRR